MLVNAQFRSKFVSWPLDCRTNIEPGRGGWEKNRFGIVWRKYDVYDWWYFEKWTKLKRVSTHFVRDCVYIRFTVFSNFSKSKFVCIFWLWGNFYSDDAHHANYAKHNLHHHFQHSVNCVYQIYSVLKLFEIAVCFAHFGFTKFLLRWCAPCQLCQTMFRSSFPILRTMYMRFKVFSHLSILLFVLHILAFTKFLLRW